MGTLRKMFNKLWRDKKMADTGLKGTRIEVYVGTDDDHYWRLVHVNGNVMAGGLEGYRNRTDLIASLNAVKTYMSDPATPTYLVEKAPAKEVSVADLEPLGCGGDACGGCAECEPGEDEAA